jgi:hypothetical protein
MCDKNPFLIQRAHYKRGFVTMWLKNGGDLKNGK